MEEKFKNLPLRDGVGIVVLNDKNKVFVAKRIDNPKYHWQMPVSYTHLTLPPTPYV